MSLPNSCDERVAPGVSVAFEATRVLYRAKSTAHEKLILENAQFGRMMMIDGVVQLSSADEFIYHEMLSHVPLLAHGRVSSLRASRRRISRRATTRRKSIAQRSRYRDTCGKPWRARPVRSS